MLAKIIAHWANPDRMKGVFVVVQLALAGAFLAVFFWISKSRDRSQFRVREADLRKGKSKAPFASDPLAQAKLKREERLALPGIRTDGAPHQILGVSPQATAREIQKAYRDLMVRYHPDKVAPPGTQQWNEAQKIASAINHAKDTLLLKLRQK